MSIVLWASSEDGKCKRCREELMAFTDCTLWTTWEIGVSQAQSPVCLHIEESSTHVCAQTHDKRLFRLINLAGMLRISMRSISSVVLFGRSLLIRMKDSLVIRSVFLGIYQDFRFNLKLLRQRARRHLKRIKMLKIKKMHSEQFVEFAQKKKSLTQKRSINFVSG